MTATPETGLPDLTPDDSAALREVLGYLNFSGGKPDPAFQRNLNRLQTKLGPTPWAALEQLLWRQLEELKQTAPAFSDAQQSEAVLRLTFQGLYPAYRQHHADLLFHLTEQDVQQPFFLARMFEAVLEQGPPWDETDRIIHGALHRLNDFLGYRPIAVLENGRRMEPYPHERFRPVPLYIRDAGVSVGPYHDVIERALELLKETPPGILRDAHFDLSQLDELALDPRAYDQAHPANKRTNYLFGEWDPHLIDLQGRYRRFVVRKIILDALLEWMAEQRKSVPRDEVLYDAAAVLSGTILMASSISGSGPETHDSTVTLTSLLPKVARQRDAFYERLLQTATGSRAKRLARHARQTQQPFGHVRQHLNMYLAEYGARQVQHRHLAYLYARMGYPKAARRQAEIIPSVSARFECEILWRVTALHLHLDQGDLAPTETLLAEMEDLLHRGIECGAFVDPWNILGFQGHMPLFSSREDSVPDQRVETLLHVVEGLMDAFARTLGEASAQGQDELRERLSRRFRGFADFWDRFGTMAVEDLPAISGEESIESATHVARALSEWRAAGESAGDISFWRQHVAEFRSAKAYAQVVAALLGKHDTVASMGLLMQWLAESEEVGLESGPHAFYPLLMRWMELVDELNADPWPMYQRLFAYLEPNAGEFWAVPTFQEAVGAVAALEAEEEDEGSESPFPDEDDSESNLFGAAYEDMVYRDTTRDGQEGAVFDAGYGPETVEFELFERYFEPRLKFLRMLVQLWQMAASTIAVRGLSPSGADESAHTPERDARSELIRAWQTRTREMQEQLLKLMEALWKHHISEPSGDHDSNIEYDLQLQTKFYLLQSVIATHISCQAAEWTLVCALPAKLADAELPESDRVLIGVYRGIMRRDATEVRRLLPRLLKSFQNRPLLYVPLDHGGEPEQVLAARTLQAIIRFLLAQLPRLGLLRETWHLLRMAQQMERSSRPQGLAVTEFDRLFRIALRNSLESAVIASAQWKSGRFSDEDLIEIVGSIVEQYLDQWLEHSSGMRLSAVEALKHETIWESVQSFIEEYGADLFHARYLTLGNVRAILHSGVEKFIEYLTENEDPLHPVHLVDAIQNGEISMADAVTNLELIYQAVVDRFDRFLEYNTTTTQSDYGEMFYTFLDFLRREVAYDRDAWNLLPVSIAHEVLARQRQTEAADIWGEVFAVKTEDMAAHHLSELHKLEKAYGMRLPSVTNHLNERFVKPLAVNQMLALIRPAMEDAREGRQPSSAFTRLETEVELYLLDTSGSGLEVPAWLRSLEEEVDRVDQTDDDEPRSETEPDLQLPPAPLTLREMRQQLRTWRESLGQKKGKEKGK